MLKKKEKKKCTGIIGLQSQQNGIAFWREMWSVTSYSENVISTFRMFYLIECNLLGIYVPVIGENIRQV